MFTIGWIEKTFLAMYVLCIVEYSVLVNQEGSFMFANWSQAGPNEVEGSMFRQLLRKVRREEISFFSVMDSPFVP